MDREEIQRARCAVVGHINRKTHRFVPASEGAGVGVATTAVVGLVPAVKRSESMLAHSHEGKELESDSALGLLLELE